VKESPNTNLLTFGGTRPIRDPDLMGLQQFNFESISNQYRFNMVKEQ
jgi:hypothetical protein